MVKEIDVSNLKDEKNKILEELKTIDKNVSYGEFLKLKNEYVKLHNKIRYYTDEEFKKKNNEYSKGYSLKKIVKDR